MTPAAADRTGRQVGDPLVSVLINNYNYAEYLRGCIDSALAQTYSRREIIVVDDGSTDASREVLRAYGDAVRVVLKENGGQSTAFNAGVAASRGDILCFLDSDDAWLPEKVERVVEALRANPAAGLLRHRMRMVTSTGAPLPTLVPGFRGSRLDRPHPLAITEGRYSVSTSALVLTRAVAREVFPMPLTTPAPDGRSEVQLRYDADAYVLFRALATGAPVYSLDETLGLYRRHDRQQYVGLQDVRRMLSRQIEMAAAVTSVFTERLGRRVTPTTVYKHQAVLAALDGRRPWHRARLGPLLRGLRQALVLWRVGPRLVLRQTLALAFAFLTPRIWVRKIVAAGGHGSAPDAAGLPPTE